MRIAPEQNPTCCDDDDQKIYLTGILQTVRCIQVVQLGAGVEVQHQTDNEDKEQPHQVRDNKSYIELDGADNRQDGKEDRDDAQDDSCGCVGLHCRRRKKATGGEGDGQVLITENCACELWAITLLTVLLQFLRFW